MDLMAKVIDLDNGIGGHNFDIPLLADTEKAIKDLSKPAGLKENHFHENCTRILLFLLLFFLKYFSHFALRILPLICRIL